MSLGFFGRVPQIHLELGKIARMGQFSHTSHVSTRFVDNGCESVKHGGSIIFPEAENRQVLLHFRSEPSGERIRSVQCRPSVIQKRKVKESLSLTPSHPSPPKKNQKNKQTKNKTKQKAATHCLVFFFAIQQDSKA